MITVVGSVNWDIAVRVAHLPEPGETIVGSESFSSLGGKGANQAVAAARMGGRVKLLACVGADTFGEAARQSLSEERVDVSGLRRVVGDTGLALIGVSECGQNSIMIAPGANASLQAEHVPVTVFTDTTHLLLPLELPSGTWSAAIASAKAAGATIVVNASPVTERATLRALRGANILLVNEVEAAQLLGEARIEGRDAALRVLNRLREAFPEVVLTLGAEGAMWANEAGEGACPAPPVRVADTTGAGDAFAGALVVALTEGKTLAQVVRSANAAGALATQRNGVLTAPQRQELERFVQEVADA
jgi:ribokinase